jgi:hypothetical protein
MLYIPLISLLIESYDIFTIFDVVLKTTYSMLLRQLSR